MKRLLHCGFLLMGFSFTVTQGLLIRELLVAFFGNELSIGLILGNWLILEAVGSGLLGRLAERWGKSASAFAILQVLFALLLPLCLYAVYHSRSIVGAIPGEGVGLVPIYYASFLILIPLALVDGAMFAFGCRAFAALTGDETHTIGRVYVYEALGHIAGGLLFTFLFIPFLASFQMVLLLCGLNLLCAALILAFHKTERPSLNPGLVGLLVLSLACLGLLLSPQPEAIQRWANRRQWAGHDLVYSENSVYGNVAVVQRASQFTFYADGIPILTAPVPDVVLSEELVHLPMSFVPRPRRALVLSGGLGGVLHELAKYPVEGIEYAELDPLLIEAVQQFPTPLTRDELSDPRVTVEHIDGRLLARRKSWEMALAPGERYDLVIVSLPYPFTLQLNRFYTAEFFQLVRGLLTDAGLLVTRCPGTLTYMSAELRGLNGMLYHTLRQAFPAVRPIPGDVTLWLASPSETLLSTPTEALVERWEGRALQAQLVTASHLRLRLSQQRLDWFWAALGEAQVERETVNRDLHPVGLFHGLSYWNALFSPQVARVFNLVGRLDLWTLGLPIAGCSLLIFAVIKRTGKGKEAVIPIAIVTTGFSGMTADLIIIFAFQTLYGYVYQWIGLLIATFMAGLTLGGLLMTRRLARSGGERSTLLKLEAALLLYWVLLPVALSILNARITQPAAFAASQAVLFLLNAIAGFLVGSQFPLANRLWLRGRDTAGGAAGLLYASDLVGAFLGSIVVSVVLLPVLGILETCVLAGLLKLGSLLLVTARPLDRDLPQPERHG
jgi:spermidine synthase